MLPFILPFVRSFVLPFVLPFVLRLYCPLSDPLSRDARRRVRSRPAWINLCLHVIDVRARTMRILSYGWWSRFAGGLLFSFLLVGGASAAFPINEVSMLVVSSESVCSKGQKSGVAFFDGHLFERASTLLIQLQLT